MLVKASGWVGVALSLFRVTGGSTLFLRPKLMQFSVSIVKRLEGVVACLAGRDGSTVGGCKRGESFYYFSIPLGAFSLRTGTPPHTHTSAPWSEVKKGGRYQ